MKKLNQLRSTPGNTNQQVNNFTELNFKEVNIWGNKVAWTFFKVDLDEEYWQLWSKEHPEYFYIRTESGNIYKIFRKDYKYLQELCNMDVCEHIMNTFPTDRCIYNPQTKTVVGLENPIIRCGEPFAYAPKCNTSKVQEIVGISSSQWGESTASLQSNLEQDFIKKMQ